MQSYKNRNKKNQRNRSNKFQDQFNQKISNFTQKL